MLDFAGDTNASLTYELTITPTLYFFATTIFQSLVKQQELSASKKYSYPDQLLVSIYLVFVLKNFVFIFFPE